MGILPIPTAIPSYMLVPHVHSWRAIILSRNTLGCDRLALGGSHLTGMTKSMIDDHNNTGGSGRVRDGGGRKSQTTDRRAG